MKRPVFMVWVSKAMFARVEDIKKRTGATASQLIRNCMEMALNDVEKAHVRLAESIKPEDRKDTP
jgi:predicted DNA-binding protein